MTHSSILVYLQSVVFASKLANCTPPSLSHPSVKMVLEGSRRIGIPGVSGAIPLTVDVLKSLYFHVNLSTRAGQVFWAACLLMFFSLLRISHLVETPHRLSKWLRM